MLFVISLTQVKELLTCAEQVRSIHKLLHIFHKWNQRYKPCCSFDGIIINLGAVIVRSWIENIIRGLLRSQVSRNEHRVAVYAQTKDFHCWEVFKSNLACLALLRNPGTHIFELVCVKRTGIVGLRVFIGQTNARFERN